LGTSQGGVGVFGTSGDISGIGVFGSADVGVQGASPDGIGVSGHSGTGPGVTGISNNGNGVLGSSQSKNGVFGQSHTGTGVFGHGTGGRGVAGLSNSSSGVDGQSTSGPGVSGSSESNEGVHGETTSSWAAGVTGLSRYLGALGGAGVWGRGETVEGVHGETNSNHFAAVAGITLNPDGDGAGIYGESRGKGPAGYFKGNVTVTGDIQLFGGDCAEQFDVGGADTCDPGTVMAIDDVGVLAPSRQEYDRRVAGVVSGAGELRPGVILDKQPNSDGRRPIALVGKVRCKAVADDAAIAVGDLLTTSSVTGHAMKAIDPLRAFGAVIGKALEPLPSGAGLIRILVALQ
jgi:hypothetical protein